MTNPVLDDALDEYLGALGRRLRLRSTDSALTDLIDECRDHILSHAERATAQGVAPGAAIGMALREFGPLETVTAGMRGEVRRQYLRQLSTALLVTGAVLGVCWRVVIAFGPAAPWADDAQPAPISAFDVIGDGTASVALLLAAASLVLLVLPGRLVGLGAPAALRAVCQRWSARSCAASAVFGATAAVQVVAYLVARGSINPGSLAWPAVTAVGVLTLAGGVVVIRPLRTVVALR